jgi:hypothetical protein
MEGPWRLQESARGWRDGREAGRLPEVTSPRCHHVGVAYRMAVAPGLSLLKIT